MSDSIYHINKIVPDDERITSEIMTLAEYTRVLSERAQQISDGSPIFVDIGDESDPIKIAEMEIKQRRCPIEIRRHITKDIVEVWKVNEMIV